MCFLKIFRALTLHSINHHLIESLCVAIVFHIYFLYIFSFLSNCIFSIMSTMIFANFLSIYTMSPSTALAKVHVTQSWQNIRHSSSIFLYYCLRLFIQKYIMWLKWLRRTNKSRKPSWGQSSEWKKRVFFFWNMIKRVRKIMVMVAVSGPSHSSQLYWKAWISSLMDLN